MWVIPLICISVISIIYFLHKRENKRFNELFDKLPSPPSWPIIGNIVCLSDPAERVNTVHKLLLENNGIVTFHGLWIKYVVVSDLEIIKKLCTSDRVKKYGKMYQLLESWIGINVFNSEGELWKKYRSLLTPLVHFDVLEKYIPTIVATSHRLIEKMRTSLEKPINVYEYVETWSLNAFLGMALKRSYATEDLNSGFLQSMHDITRIIVRRATNPLKYSDFLFRFTKDYWIQKKAVKFLRTETKLVMEQKVLTQAETDKKATTFLELMQKVRGADLSDEEICNHLQGILFGGFDTTSTVTSCVLYLLSIHQDVQEKAFREVKSIFGEDRTREYTLNAVQKMSYLEMVIKESLRLYPPGPFISKYTLEEFQLGDYLIPKNVEVFIAIGSLHRTPKYFPNPDVFDPERFAPENTINIKPFSYIPFSAGPRICLAQKVAMLSIKILVAMVIRNYKLLPVDGFQLKIHHYVTLKPDDKGIQLKLRSRDDRSCEFN